jgi:hypothetical protein
MFRLIITDPDGRRRVTIDRSEVLIGRRAGADLVLADPAAAPHHCVLRRDSDGVRVLDLGSAGGTFVRGRKVLESPLSAGDELRIGETVIRLDAAGASGLSLEPTATPAGSAGPAAPVATGTHQDFGREIRLLLRKTPWYGASLAIHILALMLLSLVPYRVARPSLQPPLAAVAPNDLPPLDTDADFQEPDVGELELEDLSAEELAALEEAGDPESAPSEGDPQRPREDYRHPEDIGAGASLLQRVSPLPRVSDVKDGGERVNRRDLAGEHGLAKKAVERGLGRGLRTIRGISRDRIVVVRGDFDYIEKVLDLYRVPHTTVDPVRLVKMPLGRARVICINCARKPLPALRERLVARVRHFVNGGGWLATSDWAVDPFITEGWAGHVRVVEPNRRQGDTVIEVQPASRNSSLLEGVFGDRRDARWWLEESSTMFRPDRSKVKVLVASEELKARFGPRTVAFEFRPGSGRVLHLLGHFYQEDGTRRGLVAMHRLILNYLQERFVTEE